MLYTFEKGNWPILEKQDEFEFNSNEEAIEFAKKNDYNYVWNMPEDTNPNWTWRKQDE